MEFRSYKKAEEKDIEPEFNIVCSKCNAVIDSICINPLMTQNATAPVIISMLEKLTNETIGNRVSIAVKRHKCS